jgi:hypothetical protein
MIIDVDLSAP